MNVVIVFVIIDCDSSFPKYEFCMLTCVTYSFLCC